ncbi:hypothetical protein CC85DRAFT_285706 [Cutaneotrichosporon oleaginosum]|uniref:C2 domain-containing protein n=1 Tax=Cutaneotrichosporon oleaginosum TaxID=879819 RepID=A0A0J1B3S2_9TREE|nr:uncharacterized protein CC85DRAFT_285706 [Cutaneotrichosporon oleaginosum]KLT42304.1 hypothetical protein CC85DRAFT_285706 [Cutaneotrichosporon oleaginosum]TXT11476.1 hypothetical protein COLE_01886 [Cutaneotrichosporon oleaginosum]
MSEPPPQHPPSLTTPLHDNHARLATPPPLPPRPPRTPPLAIKRRDNPSPAPDTNGQPPLSSHDVAAIALARATGSTPERHPSPRAAAAGDAYLQPTSSQVHTPSPLIKQGDTLDVHKELPTPPRQSPRLPSPRQPSPLRNPPPLPPRQNTPSLDQHVRVPDDKPPAQAATAIPVTPVTPATPELSAQSSQHSFHLNVPSTSDHEKRRPQRLTLRERAEEIQSKALLYAEQGDPPPIIKDTILGISPLMCVGLAVIVLLSVHLFGWYAFAQIAAFGLAPVVALWLLPLPTAAKREPAPAPQPADNVGWINHTLRTLFPLVSTDVLTPFVDLLEDALIQQVPPIVTSVRCADVTLGREPIQLTSLRTITDDEWFASITQGPSSNGRSHARTRSNATHLSVEQDASAAGETTQASDLSDFHPGTASDASSTRKGNHRRTASGISSKSNRSIKSAKSTESLGAKSRTASNSGRPLSGSSQFSQGKETAKLRKRDMIARRLRRGRRRHVDCPEECDVECEDEDKAFYSRHDDDEGEGFYVNYEVSFNYRSTREMSRKGTGLHMLAYFGWGVKGLGGSEIPVFIDVLQLSGTLRLRLLLSPSPPFVRDALFTFVKMPDFDISARPLRSFGFGSINAMDIPLLKTYVQKSIAQVAGSFVSPLHYHLDVDRLLLGKDAALQTSAVGVLYIIIHGCDDLPRTDTMGSCDPYVAASFSKFDKPLYSTRTVVNSLDPLFEESAFLLVSGESIEVGEQLLLKVCDSDRFSVDDAIGQVKVDIADIIEQSEQAGPGYELFRRHDDLEPEHPGMRVQGQIDWSVRFFPLWKIPVDEFHRRLEAIKDRRGEGKTVAPWWLQWLDDWMEKPEWETERAKRRKEMVEYITGERQRDEIEAAMPPTGEFPSGVLQFHVHQCAELEMYPDSGSFSGSNISRRKSAASGKPALSNVIDRAPGENPDPPSAYCEVHLNDKYVFRTRTKRVNPQPYFNALSERFIRDWRQARIKFVVKDERDREHDPIIGVVSLRVRDVLADRAQITRWFPILGGLGFGKLRISLLFKPIDIKLPRGVSSYEACTFDIASLQTTDLSEALGKMPTLVIESEYDQAVFQPPDEEGYVEDDEGDGGSRPRSSTITSTNTKRLSDRPYTMPHADGATVEWELPQPVRLAVQYRHSCSMVLSFVTRRVLKKKRVHAVGVLPLANVPDDELTRRTVPIFATASVRDAVRANVAFTEYVSMGMPALAATTTLGGSSVLPENVRVIGFVKIEFVLHPGVSRAHRKLCKRDLKFKAVYDAWEATRLLENPASPSDDGESESSDLGLSDDNDDEKASGKEAAAAMRDDDTRAMLHGRSHAKALHKHNKGIFQLKIARTGKFVKDKVQARVLSTTGTNLSQRPHGADVHVEKEGVSKLG